MAAVNVELVAAVRAALAQAGDPERAAAQQAYMKSALPYRGVTSPELRSLLRPLLQGLAWTDRTEWEATIHALWDHAAYREERYAALALARHRSARAWQDPATLDLYRHLVTTGAWWDLVDETAGHLVGGILAGHRAQTTLVMRAWMVDDDLWLRRTAILAQLGHGADTDLTLLSDAIEANVEGTRYGSSFWVRKAIGWALRQHARTDPDWVRAFVAAHEPQLSGLSRREALKHL